MLSSILLVILIVLGIKLINTITKVDRIIDELECRIKKIDNMFSVVDTLTDSMALISDKIVDTIVSCLKKIFSKKRKDDVSNE
jgi:uncharacterized protein YoxC